MDIKELKNKIEKNKLEDSFMIWKITDESSNIIVEQYLNEIKKLKGLKLKYIDSFDDIPFESFAIDDNLYVLRTDEWNSSATHENCIIVCNNSDNAIVIPKLENWQIVDYALSLVPGLIEQDVKWLLEKYQTKYNEFLNVIKQISCFEEHSQYVIFKQMVDDGLFDNYSKFNIFDLTNAITQRNFNTVSNLLKENIDVNPLGLAKTLYENFKIILSIQTNPIVNYSDLGISEKRLYAIKKNSCGYYSNKELINIVEFLSSTEYIFKFNGIEMKDLTKFIIINILGGCAEWKELQ